MKKETIADIALLLVAASWGLNFVITKNALSSISPFLYLGTRFLLASILMVSLFFKKIKHISLEDIKGGLIVGLFISIGFITQTLGLLYTTPSKSGFITGSNVVMVPFIAYFITKQFPGWYKVIGAIVTFAGLGMISLSENLTVNYGDILTFACAVAFALQIAFTEYYVKKANSLNITIVQITTVGVITMIMSILIERPASQVFSANVWGAIAFGAIICSAIGFSVQNIAQKYTSSTHAAVILCTESVFASLFSFLLWKEPLTLRTLTGFTLIFAGILITELSKIEESSVKMRLEKF